MDLKTGTVLTHGLLQFPDKQGLELVGWIKNRRCYYAPKEVLLRGYKAMQCSCVDITIPKGTYIELYESGNGYRFPTYEVVDPTLPDLDPI